MPKAKRSQPVKGKTKTRAVEQKVTTVSPKTRTSNATFLDRLQNDMDNNKSALNIVLGALVIVILAILLFNFFNKNTSQVTQDLGPAQQTSNVSNNTPPADVDKSALPGSYTVKDNDTLYLIAQKYYDNGYLYTKLAAANKLSDADAITVGQVLQIPKADDPAYANIAPATPNEVAATNQAPTDNGYGQGGATNQTIWGETITGNTYTVVAGDWLSKIAGRAYGDPMQYTKIAQANNIQDPNVIEPGTVLKIPR